MNKKQRAELKQKFGGHCAYCGIQLGDKWHADHIEAVQREIEHVGGGVLRTTGTMLRPQNHTLKNMNPACVPCNTNKSSMSLESWRKMIAHYRDVQLLRDSTHARHLHRFGLLEIKADPVVFYFEKLQGTPNAILEAATKRKFEHEVSECRHWSTAMWADGKAECFGCGATVNNKREVLEVERK